MSRFNVTGQLSFSMAVSTLGCYFFRGLQSVCQSGEGLSVNILLILVREDVPEKSPNFPKRPKDK
jgi:hypothetical protein